MKQYDNNTDGVDGIVYAFESAFETFNYNNVESTDSDRFFEPGGENRRVYRGSLETPNTFRDQSLLRHFQIQNGM